MPGHPQIGDFVTFANVQPFTEAEGPTCIYYLVDKRRRCLVLPSRADIDKAKDLRRSIMSNASNPCAEDLQNYALLSCCKRFHKTKLEDFGLLKPLAERWRKELKEGSQQPVLLDAKESANSAIDIAESDSTSTAPSSLPLVAHRYKLRPRAYTQTQSLTTCNAASSPVSTGFKPHQVSPSNTVASTLLENLTPRDSRIGSLYLFTRTSSPGHIKIGITQQTVQTRLSSWQRQCGYIPRLAASFSDVPHVYRVESLVHFELAKYWRTEIKCSGCPRQHQEWFEVANDYAIEVARKYVDWIKEAQPFGEDGCLKPVWEVQVLRLVERKGRVSIDDLFESLRTMQLEVREDADLHDDSREQATSETYANANQSEDDIRSIANAILALTVEQRRSLALALECSHPSQQEAILKRPVYSSPISTGRDLVRRNTNSVVMALA